MHELNRPGQFEAYQKIKNSNKFWVIIEAPTGSGKTAWAAQSGHDGNKTLALVRTKSLQEQYLKSYDFKIVKGKGNYKCLHNGVERADQCEIIPSEMMGSCKDCNIQCQTACQIAMQIKDECKASCPYSEECREFSGSNLGCLNYSKYLLELHNLVRNFEADTLFLDEAHQLSDLITEWSGLTFIWHHKNDKPDYVLNFIDKPSKIMPEYGQELSWAMGLQWLEELGYNMNRVKPPRPSTNPNAEEVSRWKRWNELYMKVENTLRMIESGKELWYIKSDDYGFLAKPLTARFHFSRLFDRADKIVLMSATIGQFSTFAAELGLSDYEAIQVPNSWPAPLRPIEDLGGPEYTYKMDENDRRIHAQLIANRIAACPDWWSGIIHVTSKSMANELGDRLRGLLDRPILVPFEGWSTEEAVDEWYRFSDREKGALIVSWSFWEGIDAGQNQISIVARCPFPDFKSSYEKARFEFDRRASLQRVANQVVQAWGRVRRGRDEDYGPTKLVAICDRKWKRLRNFISRDIMESIVEA